MGDLRGEERLAAEIRKARDAWLDSDDAESAFTGLHKAAARAVIAYALSPEAVERAAKRKFERTTHRPWEDLREASRGGWRMMAREDIAAALDVEAGA